jgi:hypothetical protein
MPRSLYRILASGAVLLALVSGASAQTLQQDDDGDHAVAGGVCGTQLFNDGREAEMLANTARINPAAYRQIVERAKGHGERAIASVGEPFTFSVQNRVTGAFDQVNATLVYDGIQARIWVDDVDSARIKPATIAQLARGLDTATGAKSRNPAKGIIENDKEVYGDTPKDWEVDGKTDFLLTDIQDGSTGGGFVAGYFSPYDQLDVEGSNRMNLLYIDSRQGLASGVNALLSTIAHEFQHLIHYDKNKNSDVLFNEGCSEVASILCGYKDRSNTTYLGNTNVSMFKWNYNDNTKVLADYERAMTFVHYMREQYGEAFLTSFVKAQPSGMSRINSALQSMGKTGDWQSTLKSFAVANYLLKSYADSRYIYQFQLSSSVAKPATTYDSSFAATGSVSLQPYASSYVYYKNPGGLKVRFKSSLSYTVMAMLYKGSTPLDVIELKNNTDYTLNDGGQYDRIVFAVVNLVSSNQSVSWTADHVALGVEDEEAATGALAVTSVAPTPSVAQTTIAFNTASAGPVTMQLFGTDGQLVRTLIDGDRYEAGAHTLGLDVSSLPNGAYILRVAQGKSVGSRVMMVMK